MINIMRLLILVAAITLSYHGGDCFQYTLSARNLPGWKNPFAEVKKGTYCKTESGGGQNPDWTTKCDTQEDQFLDIDIRNNINNGFDESIGWAHVYAKKIPKESGEMISEEIWNDGKWVGTLRITRV